MVIKKVKQPVKKVVEKTGPGQAVGAADVFNQSLYPDNQLGVSELRSEEALGVERAEVDQQDTESVAPTLQEGHHTEKPVDQVADTQDVPETVKEDAVPGDATLTAGWDPKATTWEGYSWQDTAWKEHSWGWGWSDWGNQWWHSAEFTTPVKGGLSDQEWKEWQASQVGWGGTTPTETPTSAGRSDTVESLSSNHEKAELLREQLQRSRTTDLRVSLEERLDGVAGEVPAKVDPEAQPVPEEPKPVAQHAQGGESAECQDEESHLEQLAKEQETLEKNLKDASQALPETATEAEKEDQKKAKEALQKKLSAQARYMRYFRAVRSQGLRLDVNGF